MRLLLPPELQTDDSEHAVDIRTDTEVLISEVVYHEVCRTLSQVPVESGGLLLGPKNHRAITHFHLDAKAPRSGVTFHLEGPRLTQELEPFLACAMDLKGIVHSHPTGCSAPSHGDVAYLRTLFSAPENAREEQEQFFCPIFEGTQLHPYVYRPQCGREPERLTAATYTFF
jgi:hypothetical protein